MSRRVGRRAADRAVARLTGPSAEAMELLASLALEDGRRWGEAAEPWQVADAAAILDGRAPHLHFLTRPRGASKTTDLAGVLVSLLTVVLRREARGYVFAVDRDQAALLVDAIAGFAARTEGLGGALTLESWRVTATETGARLDVMAADDASAWGLRGEVFVVEEFSQWPTTAGPRRLWSAVLSAVPKVRGCRLLVVGTAGDPAHPSARVLAHARTSRRWRVNETPGPTPWISAGALEEQRAMLPAAEYARLHLNRWTAAEDRLVGLEDLRACVTLDGPQEPRPDARYWVGVDVGLRGDRTVVAVAHAERDGGAAPRVVLDRMHVLAGSRAREVRLDDVEAAILQACRTYGRARVMLDPWQAIGTAQRLRARGVIVEEFTFSSASVGRLASTLHLLLRDRRLALPDDPELLDELANVRLRETSPGVVRMDHDPGRHDDRAIALALAALPLVSRAAAAPTGSTAGLARLAVPPRSARGLLRAVPAWGAAPASPNDRTRDGGTVHAT